VAAASAPGAETLLDWPPGRGASAEIEGLHQIVHGQKLIQDLPLFLPRVAIERKRAANGPRFTAFTQTVLVSSRLWFARDEARERQLAAAREDLAALDLRHVVLRRRELPPATYAHARDQLLLLGPSETFEDADAFWAHFPAAARAGAE